MTTASRGARPAGAWMAAAVLLAACSEEQGANPTIPEPHASDASGAASAAGAGDATETPAERPLFVDRTAGSGIDFLHRHGGAGKKLVVEIAGGGVSLLDFDGDGDLDLFFAQGAALPGYADPQGVEPADFRDRLYRNDGGFRFVDVTAHTGATDPFWTYSAACPDFDGDGDPDLYLCNAQRNTWLRNDFKESGRFTDVTDEVGAGCADWSASAAFADFDQDGDLDLYVANYVLLDLDHEGCGKIALGEQWRVYCHPDVFPSLDDRLYRNDGGRYVDVSESIGLAGTGGAGLGTVISDYDDDGDLDLFVANDSNPNFLWRNDGAMKLTEVAREAFVAVDGSGMATAAMGTDFGDVDGDGDFDLVVSNLSMELNNLYVNAGDGRFDDRSRASGFGPPSLIYVGFGLELFDADLDGDLDAMVVNGHINDNIEMYEPALTFRQIPLFLVNDGRGRFRSIGAKASEYFAHPHVARGLAVGDLDDDGDLDAIVSHNDDRPALLANLTDGRKPWVGVKLVGRGANLQAIGARVTLESGGRRLVEEVRGTSSYGAFQDLRLVFALPDERPAEKVTVRWPDGRSTVHGPLAARRYHEIRAAAEQESP